MVFIVCVSLFKRSKDLQSDIEVFLNLFGSRTPFYFVLGFAAIFHAYGLLYTIRLPLSLLPLYNGDLIDIVDHIWHCMAQACFDVIRLLRLICRTAVVG